MAIRHLVERALSEGTAARILQHAPLGERAYWRFFCSPRGGDNFQFGYYTSHAEARAAIPPAAGSGWNNAASAQHYIETSTQPSSYAVLFWLAQMLKQAMHVLDLGGSTGQMYHALRRRMSMPPDVTWTVVDVPAAVTLGQARAAAANAGQLRFTSSLAEVAPCDVLHSSGAMQFMDDPLPGLFDRLAALPRWIIINKVVLTAGPAFWTLHNIGTGICPYAVFNAEAFTKHFLEHGYIMRDRWDVTEMSLQIPFHPAGYVPHATGLCFEHENYCDGKRFEHARNS